MQRNKAATLERVLLSSVQEFAQKGFHLARVSDIAALARCSTETIYDVYVSKEGLFTAVVQHVLETSFADDATLDSIESWLQGIGDPLERAVAALTTYTAPQVDETFIAILYQVMSAKTATPASSVQSLYLRRRRFQSWLASALQASAEDGLVHVGDMRQACEVLCNATGIMLVAKRQFFGPAMPMETPFEAARNAISSFCTEAGAARLAQMAPIGPAAPATR